MVRGCLYLMDSLAATAHTLTSTFNALNGTDLTTGAGSLNARGIIQSNQWLDAQARRRTRCLRKY
jgi:hypothetical protein